LIRILLFAICIPVFLVYLIICLTIPLVRIGRTARGKGVKMWIVKDAIHSDYLFESELWRDVFSPKGKYIRIGWGDRKIFLETREWKELKMDDFMKAFWGMNGTVLRVDFMDHAPKEAIEIGPDQFKILRNHVLDSFRGGVVEKRPEYYQKGDFYESDLKYNCITNCNNWVNRGLVKAKISNRLWCPLSLWL
jgi:uncharacterized protein (TIGR02117 family)